MTSPTPRVTIARPSGSNGLLSIPASAIQKRIEPASEGTASRPTTARLKLIIRRLPPGLTQLEFQGALGPDWKVSGPRVDWMIYKPGKVSRDPAKPSRPSRAYLHLTKQEHTATLAESVRKTAFNDAKGSFKDSALLGPPTVEFAPYGRIPNSRPRKDARQGTIDQDPEFIDFLESLTNPMPKPNPTDRENVSSGKSKDKVTVTPLIQFLRDKKANKGKENTAPSKGLKHARQDTKDGKAIAADAKTVSSNTITSSPKKRSAQAIKVEQAARDAVKVLNKQAANVTRVAVSPNPTKATPAPISPFVTPNSTAHEALAAKRRERGNANAAAKILQRDLGLSGNVGGRGGRRGIPSTAANRSAASNTSVARQAPGASQTAQAAITTDSATLDSASTAGANLSPAMISYTPKSTAPVPPTGPAASRAPSKPPAAASINAASSSTPQASPKPTPPSSTATQAFLKHANPSQGITEALLEEAFAVFGSIRQVEIDKKKGFAYVDFEDAESLQKAIKASPIEVAQGQVVVLERKTGPTLQARNVRGGGHIMGNRGAGMTPGGRGGPMRGRGGFGRGATTLRAANSARAMQATATTASNVTSSLPATPSLGRATPSKSAAPNSVPSSAPAPGASIAPSDQST